MTTGEIKELMLETAKFFYYLGLEDEIGELSDDLSVEDAFKEFLYRNYIHLY